MLDVVVDCSRLLLRINVVSGSPTILPPQPTIDEHDLFEDESLDAHPMDSEDHSMELEDPIFSEEAGEECELGAQTNHTFSDENNFQINEIFSSKKELKLFLDVVVVRNSFDYATLKSCSKFLKAVRVEKESNQVKEDLEALEAEIEAEIESIGSRDRNVHIVPTHAGMIGFPLVSDPQPATVALPFQPLLLVGRRPTNVPVVAGLDRP
ncbi:hypothetical protein T459_31812 [Capsicum annuum]|uniref:Uncharacterized protein n=1 Tax=Capsicum annuum TaxID=4072 RepID=A0A2G2Y4G9_CAPAN|nr:hypothetical protein T459_31812 [Capsicum annuum]